MTTMYSEIMRLAPLRYYPLADAVGSGMAKDVSGNGADGTIHFGVTFGQVPLVKASTLTSALFNGGNGYITCPATGLPAGAQPWSMVCWLQIASQLGAAFEVPLMLGTNGTNTSAAFYFNSDHSLHIALQGTAVDIIGPVPSLNAPHFLCATYDGATLLFYYDGALQGSAAGTAALVAGLTLGSTSIVTELYPGLEAHVFVTGAVLTADQIAWLYNVGMDAGVLLGDCRAFGRMR